MSVSASQEELESLKKSGKTSRQVYSFFPADKHDCDCQPHISDLKQRIAVMQGKERESFLNKIGVFRCNKSGDYKRYQIVCNSCNELVAEVRAIDNSLADFCDLHYIAKSKLIKIPMRDQESVDKKGKLQKKKVFTDGCVWVGCLALNISPIDQHIGIECACGNDTRDFRANITLPEKQRDALVRKHHSKRYFNKGESYFRVELI